MIVCLDANIIIYYIERNPVWEPKVSARLKAIAAAGDSLAASDAALLECLVGPFQSGDSAILTDYQRFFASPDVQMLAVTPVAWHRAAQFRAAFKLKPLDSVHLASAVEHGCGLFLTNDAPLARCTAIPIEVLM